MYIKRKHIVFILFCMVLWGGCKEKDCHETGECPPELYRKRLDPLLPYLWGKAGSWWIYKNTKTGELDTQTVRSFYYDSAYVKGTEPYSAHITILHDVFQRSYYSTFSKRLLQESTTAPDPNYIDWANFNSHIIERNYVMYPIFYEFNTEYVVGFASKTTKYIGLDSTFNVQGNEFKDIRRFHIQKDYLWYPDGYNGPVLYPEVVYYWAKDVGVIIRKNISENHSWELIDYHIVK